MNYLVTGGTGFLGRFLIPLLLERKDSKVYVLVRKGSEEKFEGLVERLQAPRARLVPVTGDLTRKALVSAADRRRFKGRLDHIFHLAAVYDMNMTDEVADAVNNEGTRNVVAFANSIGSREAKTPTLHHVSSVAVAGALFEGTFTEDMFDEGQALTHPYYRTKFQSEAIVREHARVPWRVYRPGMVVGHSETGEMDKIDGPYYFFKAIQRVRDRVPKWMPLLGEEGGYMPIAPVDFVVRAMDYIAHQDGLDGQAFFLLQTPMPTVGDLLAALVRAAHGPDMVARTGLLQKIPGSLRLGVRRTVAGIPFSDKLDRLASRTLGVPLSTLGYAGNRARFDDSRARAALEGSGIECPKIEDYAENLWRYWEAHMDFDVKVPRRLLPRAKGKVVVVTGASSGIGFSAARKLGKVGAKVCLVARTREKLEETQQVIRELGGQAWIYPCDLSDMEAIDACAEAILADHGHVDVLVNNAGHSIRRSVYESLGRFHDFERTMRLNYFGAIRMIMALLPSMGARRAGHIINISTLGVLTNVPRFSAYVASKAALDAFSRCFSAEVKSRNIHVTIIYMPLVRTPMIAPTRIYDYFPSLTPDQASDMIMAAIISRPKNIKTLLGTTSQLSYALWPNLNDYVLNKGFHLFPSSAAARGVREQEIPSAKSMVFANLLRGLHW